MGFLWVFYGFLWPLLLAIQTLENFGATRGEQEVLEKKLNKGLKVVGWEIVYNSTYIYISN